MLKFQNYSHYKLPICKDPLKYGKLIDQSNNKFIVQISTKNIAVITQSEKENLIKIFKNGDLVLEYKDKFTSDTTFIRYINNTRFLFENDKLISTQILSALGQYINITPFINIINQIKSSWNWIYENKFAELFILYELTAIFLIFWLLLVVFPGNETALATSAAYTSIKLRKTKGKNFWNESIFNFGGKLFSTSLFKSRFNKFWDSIVTQFKDNNHMFILFKIKYENNDFVSIGKVQRINKSDKNWYIDFILENMKFKSEYYNETLIKEIIFSYGFKNGTIPNKDRNNIHMKTQKIKDINIPISMNPDNFGRVLNTMNIDNGKVFIIQNKNGDTVMFSKFYKYNFIEYLKNGISLIKFKDEIISENKFVRIIDNKKYYFENGQQFLVCKEMKTKFISKTSKSKNLVNKFITLDIETFVKDNILTPFCISIYDGKIVNYFYLTDYKDVDDMILTALRSIMVRKYNRYNVYMHNMAKFDIIFLFKYLLILGLIHPVIHNGRIISIEFNFGPDSKYQLKFRDSLLLTLNSLNRLCKAFKIENPKSIFPIFFVNENNLEYSGKVPEIKYFKGIDFNEYQNYTSNFNNNWNLKDEAVKYCNLDCISLYQVIFKFNDMIFNLFGKNIHHFPTLPSLAFAIFRSNFMTEENIPQLSGEIAKDIRSGYTGGAVDMYIPESKPGVKIKCYDVNSLYPSQMESRKMPIGVPTYFSGNILNLDQNAYGFFYCKIIAPDNIKHPIIQTHVKTNNGSRTISPIGTWEDMLFSEELNNAKKYGYKFEILWGYTFKSEIIFKEYVDYLYNLRSLYDKSDPLNFIAKILLNSLYGRFGMDDNFPELNIIHKDYLPDFENKYFDRIIKKTELDDYFLIEFEKVFETDDETHNISIGIASAITAYSRIHMSQFKNNQKINLYYTDTDSIYVDEKSEIEKNLIDNKILGKLKLEHVCNKAIFLSAKVYCLETSDVGLVYKVKGLKHEVELTMSDFEQLLFKNSNIKKSQLKFRKYLEKSHIEVLEHVYTLQVTDNKRKLIYNENNKLINTEAYRICETKDIRI